MSKPRGHEPATGQPTLAEGPESLRRAVRPEDRSPTYLHPDSDATEPADGSARVPRAPATGDVTCELSADQVFGAAPVGDSNLTGDFTPSAELAVTRVAPPETGGPTPGRGTMPAGTATPEGAAVPGYQILEELGRGGMGVVYKARDLRLHRLVALKMILAGAHAGAIGLARFRAEAAAVAQLQHPNIVQIYDSGEHEGRPYFCLEFVEGGSLEQRLQEGTLPARGAAHLVETLARAMAVAHERGIVHRDLKPANILLGTATTGGSSIHGHVSSSASGSASNDSWSPSIVPKIADFGLAKRVDDESSGQTHSGAVLGTPSYMAPEQAEGKNREIGPATDVYALGAILYEVLTGRPPFKAGNPIDTIRQVIEQEPVPPRALDPGVPRDLETICLKCLEKEPAKRYAGAVALADDLHRFLTNEPVHHPPHARVGARRWKWGRRRPAVVALLGVSFLAVIGLVLFIVWHNVSLQGQLDQARADEREARQREQDAIEAERVSRVEAEGEKLYHDAQVAVRARDWAGARLHLTGALAAIGDEPQLQERKRPLVTLLAEVEEHLKAEADQLASQVRFEKFVKLRDEALFLGCLYTGMDLAGNIQATRDVVERALAVYSVSAKGEGKPSLDTYLGDARKKEVLSDCYQLLLIRAETEAQAAGLGPSTGQAPKLREALRLLEQALRFGPPSRAYHLRASRYRRQLGDADGSRREEKSAAGVPVRDVLDHFLVGDEYYRRGSFDEAIREFTRVLDRQPTHFWAEYLSALCLLRLKRPAEARTQLGACLAQRSDFVWIYLLRSIAHGELQDYDAAEADFKKALALPLDDSARYVLLVTRGVQRVRQNRLDDGVADLKEAIARKPKEYQAHVNLATAYRRLKKPDDALAELNRAVALDPTVAHLYRLRALLYVERKEPVKALADLDQAVRRENPASPAYPDFLVERGRLLLQTRKHADALASFDEALRRRKDHPLAQRLRADALFQLGRFKEVVEAFDHYLEAGKPLESVYRGRGLAHAAQGQYAAAIEDYTKALELRPTSTVQAYRGWAHLVVDAPKLALRDFELAVKLDANNADAYCGRGFLLAGKGKTRDAVRDAELALRKGARTPRLLYNVARIYAQCGAGNESRAVELLRQSLGLMPAAQRASFWNSYVKKDAALEKVRRRRSFQQLEAEVTRKR